MNQQQEMSKAEARTAPVPPVVHAEDVHKSFGETRAVDGVSFDVYPGMIFGLVGPSGSGKTTLIRLMLGVYQLDSGQLRVFEGQPNRLGARLRARIGYMPQLFVMYPNLTVEENLDFSAGLHGMGWLARRKPKRQLLQFVELWDHRRKLARKISGGMQRRLELAGALIHDPRLVFLDEPTAGIDPILRAKFWNHFREVKAQGKTLFVTTQVVTEAENCDQVLLMAHGKQIALGTPVALRRQAFAGELINFTGPSLTGQQMIQLEQEIARQLQLQAGTMGADKDTAPEAERLPRGSNQGDQVDVVRVGARAYQVRVPDAAAALPQVVNVLQRLGIEVQSIEQYRPPFDDVFLRLIREWEARHPGELPREVVVE